MHTSCWLPCVALLLLPQAVQDRRDLPALLTGITQRSFDGGDASRLDVALFLGRDPLMSLALGGEASATRVGSLDAASHALFAGVAMQFAARGELDLEEAVGKLLPELGPAVGSVTVHELLTHTSGLHDWQEFTAGDPAERLKKIGAAGTWSEPGTCLRDSSGDTFALGMLLARLGKGPVMERVEQGLFDAAGATDVADCREGTSLPGLAGALGERELCGSAADLAALMRAWAARKLCSDAAWAAMTTGDILPDGSRTRFGHGFDLARLAERERVAFGGEGGGARISTAYYPAFDLTVVVLAAGERKGKKFDAEALERDLARAVFAIDEPRIRDLPLDAEVAARYTGEYLIGCDRTQIEFRDRRLVLRLLRREELILLHQGEELFVAEQDHDLSVRFEAGDTRAPSFVLSERGFEVRGKRID